MPQQAKLMENSNEKSTPKPNVLLIYILLGPPVGALTASSAAVRGLPQIDFTAIFFSYFFFSPTAVIAALSYLYYVEKVEPKISSHKMSGPINITVGGVIGGLSTIISFLLFSSGHDPIKAITHPITIIGAATSAFCAFLLTGGPIERVSSTPDNGTKKE
jgi:hypothetical protein